MRPIHLAVMLLLALGAGAPADDQGDRQKLLGTWEPQGAAAESNPASSWTFSTARNSMQVTEAEGGKKITDFACGTEGTPCEVKTAGKKATVSMWFNGPSLVEMETKGSDVVKRRFKILAPGDAMEMEVIPIVPSGKTETLQFKRAQPAARQE